MELSVVVPAFNEARSIKKTVERVLWELSAHPIEFEVIVVCDGNKDDSHRIAARTVRHGRDQVIRYEPNQGKGYALKLGAERARGKLVCFYDAGGDFSPDQIVFFYYMMKNTDIDVVIGSKRHLGSVLYYPKLRRLYSFVYQVLIRLLFNLHIRDTQVGLKMFRKAVLEAVLPRVLVKRFAFDLELLVVAKTLGFRKIIEAPIKMNFNQLATGVSSRAIENMLKDTLAIFYRDRVIRYYRRPQPERVADLPNGQPLKLWVR